MDRRDRNRRSIWARSPSRSPSPATSDSSEHLSADTHPPLEDLQPHPDDQQQCATGNLSKLQEVKSEKAYGKEMLPGEGSAIAKYVAAGQRIPRRGEIGLDPSRISSFESSGYVMSGSRHAAMNAVRLRKENQVIGVEAKRKLALEMAEERRRREEEIVKGFKSLINERLRKSDQ